MGSPGQIVAQAAVSGYDEGHAHKQQQKDELSAEDRQMKAQDLIDTRHNTLANLPSIKGLYGEDSPQYKNAINTITQSQYDLSQLYDPIKAPGRLQQDWHYLRERIHGIKQPTPTPTQSPAVTLPAFAPAPITTPEMPAYQQTTPGLPSQGGGVTTTVPGVAATTMPGMASAPIAMPAVSLPKVTKMPWAVGRVQELKDKAMQKAQQEAGLLASGAGLTPEEQAKSQAGSQAALRWDNLRADMANWDKDNPKASKQDREAVYSQLYEKYIGTTGRGSWETINGTIADPSDPTNRVPVSYSFDKVGNRLTNLAGSPIPPEIASTFVPDPKASGATSEELKEYAADTDPKKDPFPQWLASKRAQGSASSKPKNKDDRYIEIEQKKALGQPLTPDDQAFMTAYDVWTQKTKVDPGVARAAAYSAYRYIPIIDPANPQNVVLMQAAQAAKAGANTPASIGFKTDAAITKYMTSGQGATNINYFNTAMDHLRLLQQAGENLGNGNIQAFNNIAQRFGISTGQPQPVEFNAVKSAVAGELSKTFKGTGATDQEISEINQNINMAQSPAQIVGAINYYIRLMDGKMDALKGQYEQGRQGKPNFPGSTPNPSNTPKSKGSVSIERAMSLPKYKGKSKKEVSDAITAQGYTPIP